MDSLKTSNLSDVAPPVRSPPASRSGHAASDSTSPPFIFQRLDTTASYPYTFSEYVRRFLWAFVQTTLIRFSPRRAHGWRRFWLRRFGAQMAQPSYTKNTTIIRHPWLLKVGLHSAIAEDVEIYNLGPVTIGDHSVISQRAYICAGTHDYTKPDLPLLRPPISIGHGVWVCADAFIGPGVTIGDNSIVGARSVVTRDVPTAAVVAGNPARVIKARPMPAST